MSNMNWKAAVSGVLAAWSIIAVAADESKAFKELDTDHDGYISRAEGTSRPDVREHWNTIDVNKDGKLSPKEFSDYEKIPHEPFPPE
jgi:Ca2+-binding EF-hand superfamily protein